MVPKKGTGPLGQLSYNRSLWFARMIDRRSEVHKVTSISARVSKIVEFQAIIEVYGLPRMIDRQSEVHKVTSISVRVSRVVEF